MTIAIALAVIAVLAAIGVWLLRRQAAVNRDFGPARKIDEGPPPGTDEADTTGPADEVPWRHEEGSPGEAAAATGSGQAPPRRVLEEPVSSAAPEALDALETVEPFPPEHPAGRPTGSTRADTSGSTRADLPGTPRVAPAAPGSPAVPDTPAEDPDDSGPR